MKYFLIIILLFFTMLYVRAEEYFDLEWKDIAPKRYENIKENKFYFTRNARYWTDRKVCFEKRLQICKNLEETKQNECLMQLLKREDLYTQRYNEERHLRILKNLLIFRFI